MAHLKQIYATNINERELKPIDLLNKLLKLKLENIFPNVCIALRIFCTLPVSVSSNERSFGKLAIIKNKLRNSTNQDRLVSLSILSIESEFSRKIDFEHIIDKFATSKARRIVL